MSLISAVDDIPSSLVTVNLSIHDWLNMSPSFTSALRRLILTLHFSVRLSLHSTTTSSSMSICVSVICTATPPKMSTTGCKMFSSGKTSSNTRLITFCPELPASSVTTKESVHECLATSPELMTTPSKEILTLQFFVTLSVQEATNLSPTYNSLSLMRISSTPVISTEEIYTVTVGGVTSTKGTEPSQLPDMFHISGSSCVQFVVKATAIPAKRNSLPIVCVSFLQVIIVLFYMCVPVLLERHLRMRLWAPSGESHLIHYAYPWAAALPTCLHIPI